MSSNTRNNLDVERPKFQGEKHAKGNDTYFKNEKIVQHAYNRSKRYLYLQLTET